MAINELTIVHLSGNAISASKHTTQTTKINEVIDIVNSHTDTAFYGADSDGLVDDSMIFTTTFGRTVDFSIAALSWDSMALSYYKDPFDGGYIVELFFDQWCEPGTNTDEFIQDFYLYESNATTSPWIMSYHAIVQDNTRWFVTKERTSGAGYWRHHRFPIGLYRCGADTSPSLVFSIYNPDAADDLLITYLYIRGYHTDSIYG